MFKQTLLRTENFSSTTSEILEECILKKVCILHQNSALHQSHQFLLSIHRMTESQNDRGWKESWVGSSAPNPLLSQSGWAIPLENQEKKTRIYFKIILAMLYSLAIFDLHWSPVSSCLTHVELCIVLDTAIECSAVYGFHNSNICFIKTF